MEFLRASGLLLHPTSLPGRYGIGDLGDSARRFIDFLAEAGQRLWQIMPLGPTGFGDSPYQALSAFAGNPLLINPDGLAEQGYLASWDLDRAVLPEGPVDYGAVIANKNALLRQSFENFQKTASSGTADRRELADFVDTNRSWLEDFSLYVALKEQHGGAGWGEWEHDIATRRPAALKRSRKELGERIAYYQYLQWQFFRQWSALKTYANDVGVRIVGDMPIFIAFDSADAWAHPELFYFEDGQPTLVAGVPPDFFSPTGQRWGNPLYRWDAMAADGYAWWIARFRGLLKMVDVVRIDHFRGFEAYWAVPADEETAENGEWVQGPGLELFDAVVASLGPLPLIAEDLGEITPEVEALRVALGIPGMKVLQFAFAESDPDHPYLPHNYERNCVVYTGTHDNDTTLGWWRTAGEEERMHAQKYLGRHGDDINWDLIRLALMSVADTAIFPLQDVLGVCREGRMNTPGSAAGNWSWRYGDGALNEWVQARLRDLTEMYGRAPRPPGEAEEDAESP